MNGDTVNHKVLFDLNIQVQRLDERIEGRERALEIQAKEYERRLDALNGEAGRLLSMQSNYIPREVYEQYAKDASIKHEKDIMALNEKIATLQKLVYVGLGIVLAIQFAIIIGIALYNK